MARLPEELVVGVHPYTGDVVSFLLEHVEDSGPERPLPREDHPQTGHPAVECHAQPIMDDQITARYICSMGGAR